MCRKNTTKNNSDGTVTDRDTGLTWQQVPSSPIDSAGRDVPLGDLERFV